MTSAILSLLIAGQSSLFPSIDEAAAHTLVTDAFNKAGVPKGVHQKLTENMYPVRGSGKPAISYQTRTALAQNVYAKFPKAKKDSIRMEVYRQNGIACLRFAEINKLLGTTKDQQMALNVQLSEVGAARYNSFPKDPVKAQSDEATRRLNGGKKLRAILTESQRTKLAKFLGGEAYLTAFGGGGGLIHVGPIWHDGGLSMDIVRAELGIPAGRSKEIGDKYGAIAQKDGTRANAYLYEIETGLSKVQNARLEQLRMQARGAASILIGAVASKLGLSVKQVEEITEATIATTASQRRAMPSLNQPGDSKAAKKRLAEQARFQAETARLIDEGILSRLTAAQQASWRKMQGKPLPGITLAEVAKQVK